MDTRWTSRAAGEAAAVGAFECKSEEEEEYEGPRLYEIHKYRAIESGDGDATRDTRDQLVDSASVAAPTRVHGPESQKGFVLI